MIALTDASRFRGLMKGDSQSRHMPSHSSTVFRYDEDTARCVDLWLSGPLIRELPVIRRVSGLHRVSLGRDANKADSLPAVGRGFRSAAPSDGRLERLQCIAVSENIASAKFDVKLHRAQIDLRRAHSDMDCVRVESL